jgi:hypothetical protein
MGMLKFCPNPYLSQVVHFLLTLTKCFLLLSAQILFRILVQQTFTAKATSSFQHIFQNKQTKFNKTKQIKTNQNKVFLKIPTIKLPQERAQPLSVPDGHD